MALALLAISACATDPSPPGEQTPASREPPTTASPTGALGNAEATSCAVEYRAAAIAKRGFAFDGTAVDAGPSMTDRGGEADLGLAAVTFEVHEWFVGGPADTITVDLQPPEDTDPAHTEPAPEAGPGYTLGTRLLVSGEHRWGGQTDEDLIGWGCGFTRFFDAATAARWRAATE